jgi:predicted porin
MKNIATKVLFALIAISMVAVSAQAATIFQKDGFTYNLNGDLQIQLRQDVGGDDQDLDVDYDDLEIKNSVSYELANGLTAFGQLDFSFNDKANDSDKDSGALEEAYVGLGYQNYSILMGKSDNAVDGFGVSAALETYSSDDLFDFAGKTGSDDMIMVKADFDMVNVIASYEVEGDNQENESTYEILATANVAGIDLGFAYQNLTEDVAYETYEGTAFSSDDDTSIYGFSIAYDAEVIWVGADYSIADFDGDKINQWNIAASIPVSEATSVAAGYTKTDMDDIDEDDVAAYYFNVQHMLHKNVKIFAEIGDTDEDGADMGYLAGMQVKF